MRTGLAIGPSGNATAETYINQSPEAGKLRVFEGVQHSPAQVIKLGNQAVLFAVTDRCQVIHRAHLVALSGKIDSSRQ
jgi:hypothetical protein